MRLTMGTRAVGKTGIVLALPFALALATGGCGLVSRGSSETTDSLSTGDCLVSLTARGSSARVIDCSMPHRGQVVGVYDAVSGPYPGADQLASEAREYCEDAFEEFVGSNALTSVLDLFPLLPTESSWDEGDHSVVCVASTYDNSTVVTTFKDSHR